MTTSFIVEVKEGLKVVVGCVCEDFWVERCCRWVDFRVGALVTTFCASGFTLQVETQE